MNCVLGGEIIYIKDLLSRSLSLCLSPRSLPSLSTPLQHPCMHQLEFFDFNHQKHTHCSKHKAGQIIGEQWQGSHQP